jgi:hypothetical protein
MVANRSLIYIIGFILFNQITAITGLFSFVRVHEAIDRPNGRVLWTYWQSNGMGVYYRSPLSSFFGTGNMSLK